MSPNLRTRLSEVLLGAFDRRGLERLVRKRLGGLDAGVNFDQDPESIAFDLVDVAERRGDVEGLVRGIQAERPNRPDVAELVALFGLPPASGPVAATAAATAGAPAVPGWVRDNVIRLNEQFQQRKLQLRYLGGYKQLHDGLHTLQDLQEGIAQAADRFR
ncbi:MAG TPA: effector-associated domain EAD1-containing protein, partial [Isosphaeraceae bacterium]